MKCQVCGIAVATVHVKEMKNDQVTEMHLCEKCAREKGYHSMLDESKHSLASQFIWMAENLFPETASKMTQVQCSECGLKHSDFMRTGRLGCPSCYRELEGQLKQILRRVHGSVRHVGKAPGKEGEVFERRRRIQKLHEELDRAIEREEYEQAAVIVSTSFETMGLLVYKRIARFDLVMALAGGMMTSMHRKLSVWLEATRTEQNQPSWAEWFKWIARMAHKHKTDVDPAHERPSKWKP